MPLLRTCTHSKLDLRHQSTPGERPGRNLDPGAEKAAVEVLELGRKLHFLKPNRQEQRPMKILEVGFCRRVGTYEVGGEGFV